jgi:hypothetical protein
MVAGILHKNLNFKWTKYWGTEPTREVDDYPWFRNGNEFVRDRVNDLHLTNAVKGSARDKARGK